MRSTIGVLMLLSLACNSEPPLSRSPVAGKPVRAPRELPAPTATPLDDPDVSAVTSARTFRPPDPSCTLADARLDDHNVVIQWQTPSYNNFVLSEPGEKLCPHSSDSAWRTFPKGYTVTAQLLVGTHIYQTVECRTFTLPNPRPLAELGKPSSPAPGSYSLSQLCKAGIAKTMGRSASTMQTRPHPDGVFLSYTRDDGSVWTYRCRVEGSRIIWASDTGRWRNHPLDEVLTFRVESDGRLAVSERYSDGSTTSETFTVNDLGF